MADANYVNQWTMIANSAVSNLLSGRRQALAEELQNYNTSFKERAWQADYARLKAENDLAAYKSQVELDSIQKARNSAPYLASFENSLNQARAKSIITGDPSPIRDLQIPQEILDTNDPAIVGGAWAQKYQALSAAENLNTNSTMEKQFKILRQGVNDFAGSDPANAASVLQMHSLINAVETEAKQNFAKTGSFIISQESATALREMSEEIAVKTGESKIRNKPEALLPKIFDADNQMTKGRQYALGQSAEETSKMYDAADDTLNIQIKSAMDTKSRLEQDKANTRGDTAKQKIQEQIDGISRQLDEFVKQKTGLVSARAATLGQFQQSYNTIDKLAEQARSSAVPGFKQLSYGGIPGGPGSGKKLKNEAGIKTAVMEGQITVDEAVRKIQMSGASASKDLIDFLTEQKQRGL